MQSDRLDARKNYVLGDFHTKPSEPAQQNMALGHTGHCTIAENVPLTTVEFIIDNDLVGC